MQSRRLNLTEKQFFDLITNDWWMYGDVAVKNNVADEVVNVMCTHELIHDRTKVTVHTFFGSFDIIYSGCSLIWDPLEIKIHGDDESGETSNYLKDHQHEFYITDLITDLINKSSNQQLKA